MRKLIFVSRLCTDTFLGHLKTYLFDCTGVGGYSYVFGDAHNILPDAKIIFF